MSEFEEEAPSGEVEQSLSKYVQEMIELGEQRARIEADLTQINQRYDDIRKRLLPDLMESEGLVGPDGKGRFTHDSGAKIHLTHKVRASVAKASEAEFFTYLRQRGNGALIKETVHPQTLMAYAKELIENGEPLPPMLSAHVETMAVITLPKQGDQF